MLLKSLSPTRRTFCVLRRRDLSRLSQSEKTSVQSWIAKQRLPVRSPPCLDHVSSWRLDALRCTIPTLDGTIPSPSHRALGDDFAEIGTPLSPGHHLIFCNHAVPERNLNTDATSSVLLPPVPLTRRMWAGGKFEFMNPVRVGDNVVAQTAVRKIEAKRLDSERPMIIMEQDIEMRIAGSIEEVGSGSPCIREKRLHVYIPVSTNSERRVRTEQDLPQPEFSLAYTPTDTTLFRFSALTFNAHRVHLSKEYAQDVEKLTERLVHGPMTALMLLETMENNRPVHSRIQSLEYRATNPLFVNRRITVHGAWLSEREAKLWAQSDEGVVGMVGEVRLTMP